MNRWSWMTPNGMLLASCLLATLMQNAWSQESDQRRIAAKDAGRDATPTIYEPGEVHQPNSRVFIHVQKTGLGHEHGVAGMLKQGRIALDGEQTGGEIVFDMRSLDADSDEARRYVGLSGSTDTSTRQQVNANLHGAAILDTQTHPTATFKIKSVTKLAVPSRRGLPQYQLDGDFTLRGVANPIRVTADAEQKNGWLHLRGGFAILQTSYGIQPFKKAFGAIGVADRLEIWGDLWLAQSRLIVPDRESR